MYRIISLLSIMGLLASCGNHVKKTESGSVQEIMSVSVSDFLNDASPFVDQAVDIQGRVVHVCRHGGQRLFIIGEEGESRIRITTGENIPEFDVALEGEKLQVTGTVKELIIDETYLAEWEAEVLEGSKNPRGEGHEGGVGHGENHGESQAADQDTDQQVKDQLAKIQQLRDEIAGSGTDHLSDYWIETIEFKILNE